MKNNTHNADATMAEILFANEMAEMAEFLGSTENQLAWETRVSELAAKLPLTVERD